MEQSTRLKIIFSGVPAVVQDELLGIVGALDKPAKADLVLESAENSLENIDELF